MGRDEREQINRMVDHAVKELFGDGTVERAVLLRGGDEPGIEPGQMVVRVFVAQAGAADEPALAAWREAHEAQVARLTWEASARLPSTRRIEFSYEAPGAPLIAVEVEGEQPPPREIVTRALTLLRENYVFPELGEQAAVAVEAHLAAGDYGDLDEIALTELVTRHLQEITGDKHLGLRLGGGPQTRRREPARPDGAPDLPPELPDDPELRRLAMRQRFRLDNFGIRRVERLDGNVGYVDLRRMPEPANAGPAIAAAMELVAGSYALIIDMRKNGGGSPQGVVFWCSYLVAEQPAVHLNDIYRADTAETTQFWSLPYVPGPRYLDRPVYVLTSARTFSGGEDLCYTLQAIGRAEIIGETTGGGAHPTRGFPVSPGIHIAVPFARSVNPVTGTNWQGTGVVPDVAVAADQAFDVAYARALRGVLELAGVPRRIAHEARDALVAMG